MAGHGICDARHIARRSGGAAEVSAMTDASTPKRKIAFTIRKLLNGDYKRGYCWQLHFRRGTCDTSLYFRTKVEAREAARRELT